MAEAYQQGRFAGETAAQGQNTVSLEGTPWVMRITVFFLACVVVVSAADLLFVYYGLFPSRLLARSFDITLEESTGTWLSATLALFVGLVAAAIAVHGRKHDPVLFVVGWGVVGLFFAYMSVDDTAKIHERLGTLLQLKLEQSTDTPLSGWFPSYGWQLFVAPFFVAMGFFILWFCLKAVAPRARIWVLIALGLYAIAMGLDFIEGHFREMADEEFPTHLMQLTEETLEMLGTTAFLFAFLSTLALRVKLVVHDIYR